MSRRRCSADARSHCAGPTALCEQGGACAHCVVAIRVATEVLLAFSGSTTATACTPLLCNTATPTRRASGGEATNVIPTELVGRARWPRVCLVCQPSDLTRVRTARGWRRGSTVPNFVHGGGRSGAIDLDLGTPAGHWEALLFMEEHDPWMHVPIPMLLPGYTDARYREQARHPDLRMLADAACRGIIGLSLIHCRR